jgi:hypothetical protein
VSNKESLDLSQQVHQAYVDVFTSPQGQVVLKDLANAHYFDRSTFNPEALRMAEAEGERNVVLRIRTILNTDPDQITLVPK